MIEMRYANAFILLLAQIGSVHSTYFPPKPEGVVVLKSKFHENVTISYKQPGICETTPNVKSYSGYVHLPPGLLSDIAGETQDYPINTFFWFFEARKDPANAPLSIWINGGPGGSSMMGLLQENGPCFVGNDSNSTYLNPFSWNNEVNMLYLDQPSQVGYSYDVATNGTRNIDTWENKPADFSDGYPTPNNTFLIGTFASQNENFTANSTIHAAHAIWHFAQTWFEEFPFYKPETERIHLWTESYGGIYGPAFFGFFQEENEKIANGSISEPGAHYLHLDTLGIINGCIDFAYRQLASLDMAYNNTYGIKSINDTQYATGVDEFWKPGGCKDQLADCREAVGKGGSGAENKDADEICSAAMDYCDEHADKVFEQHSDTPRGRFDIAHPRADPFPPPYLYGFLNQHWVQAALGVPVNHTSSSGAVSHAFHSTGDYARGTSLDSLAYLLDSGVKVATMYGDRDWACNWLGGEREVLDVEYSGAEGFRSAGYEPVVYGSESSIGGQVRQYGNYSFARVYQAGHEIPSYQPEVSYEIFMRATFNKDIPTGLFDINDNFQTKGPASVFHIKNEPPEFPNSICYILNKGTCTEEQYAQVLNGTVLVKDFVVVEYDVEAGNNRVGISDNTEMAAQKVLGH